MLRIPDRVRLALRHSGLALLNSPTSSFWSCQFPAQPKGRTYSGGSRTALGEAKTLRKFPAREILLVRGRVECRQEIDRVHLSEFSQIQGHLGTGLLPAQPQVTFGGNCFCLHLGW